jgi:hypothetical protein
MKVKALSVPAPSAYARTSTYAKASVDRSADRKLGWAGACPLKRIARRRVGVALSA